MKLIKAIEIAERIVAQLQPFCERIDIAGSIRRKKEDVGDIEIVCIRKGSELFSFVGAINKYVIIKGGADGKYTQRIVESEHGQINLDLFMPSAPDYFRQLAIRTGSSDYSARVIASGWKAKGWCGTDGGLRMIKECRSIGKNKWVCITSRPTLPPVWHSEEEFFEWLGIEWIEPEKRI